MRNLAYAVFVRYERRFGSARSHHRDLIARLWCKKGPEWCAAAPLALPSVRESMIPLPVHRGLLLV